MEIAAEDGSCAAPVRVLLVADIRSPHTWGWVDAVRSAGVVVLGADGLPWPERPRPGGHSSGVRRRAQQWLRSFAGATPRRLRFIGRLRRVAGPPLALVKGRKLRRVVTRVQPDLIHGMRIPYEALTALVACPPAVPLATSIWGIDFTNDASRSRMAGLAARKILARTDLLFADCQRDIDLAGSWGLRPGMPTAVLPGGGGIELTRMAEIAASPTALISGLSRPDYRLIVNARGRRPYVRNDVLLAGLALLADDLDPRVRVVFVDSTEDRALRRCVDHHPLASRIIVTGKLPRGDVIALFRKAEVSVSITDQDGTSNSLLEAMAAGAIPVCGDLPPVREWIEDGKNGFLAAFDSPQEVAEALRHALGLSAAERATIGQENFRIVDSRAERSSAGKQAAREYRSVLLRQQHAVPISTVS
jgi:glycosyltransferase involved in cell wall biosynthesis